jgi:hypothetical protein
MVTMRLQQWQVGVEANMKAIWKDRVIVVELVNKGGTSQRPLETYT